MSSTNVLIILENGLAFSMGANNYHQTGYRESQDDVLKWYQLPLPSGYFIVDCSIGYEFYLLIIKDNTNRNRLYSIGCNSNGRAGVGSITNNKLQLCHNVEDEEFKFIATSAYSSAAITTAGKLYTWGCNSPSNLGHESTEDITTPLLVETLKDYEVEDIGISTYHSVVITKSPRKLFVCGEDKYKACGTTSMESEIYKTFTENIDFNTKIPVGVYCSEYQTYILTIDYTPLYGVMCEDCKKFRGYNYFIVANEISENLIVSKKLCVSCYDRLYTNHNSFLQFNNEDNNCLFTFDKIKSISTDDSSEINQCMKCKSSNRMLLISVYDSDRILCFDCAEAESFKVKDSFLSLGNMTYKQIKETIKNHNSLISQSSYSTLPSESKINVNPLKNTKKSSNLNSNQTADQYYTILSEDLIYEFSSLLKEIYLDLNSNELSYYISTRTIIEDYNNILITIMSESNKNFYDRQLSSSIKYLEQNCLLISKLYIESSDCINVLTSLFTTLGLFLFKYIDYDTIKSKSHMIKVFFPNLNQLIKMFSTETETYFDKYLEEMSSNNEIRTEISFNRVKASLFYQKNTPDDELDSILFYQLVKYIKNSEVYQVKDFRCKKDNRLFYVRFKGEGSSDAGGPYRDLFHMVNKELESISCNIFIQTPNYLSEVGSDRDKLILNPFYLSKKTQFNERKDALIVLGKLLASSVFSGLHMTVNVHNYIWYSLLDNINNFELNESRILDYLMLNEEGSTFNINDLTGLSKEDISLINKRFTFYETIDLHFYNLMKLYENLIVEKDYDSPIINDIDFTVYLSNNVEISLFDNKERIDRQVSFYNLELYVLLCKRRRVIEFNQVLTFIKQGVEEIIPNIILSFITYRQFERFVYGNRVIDINNLRENTRTSGLDATQIEWFWDIYSNEFNEIERAKYLRFV